MWHRKAMDKKIVEAMATKFSENFVISLVKKHDRNKIRKNGRRHAIKYLNENKMIREIKHIIES